MKKELSEVGTILASEEDFKKSSTNIFRKVRKFVALIEFQQGAWEEKISEQ